MGSSHGNGSIVPNIGVNLTISFITTMGSLWTRSDLFDGNSRGSCLRVKSNGSGHGSLNNLLDRGSFFLTLSLAYIFWMNFMVISVRNTIDEISTSNVYIYIYIYLYMYICIHIYESKYANIENLHFFFFRYSMPNVRRRFKT